MNNNIKISKTSYKACVNMWYNAYNVSIKVDFADGNGYYRRWNVIVIANDGVEARNIAKDILERSNANLYCPVSFNDEQGWKNFIDLIRPEFENEYNNKIN